MSHILSKINTKDFLPAVALGAQLNIIHNIKRLKKEGNKNFKMSIFEGSHWNRPRGTALLLPHPQLDQLFENASAAGNHWHDIHLQFQNLKF